MVKPRIDTGKTPKPETVTMLAIAHELKISLTEFYFNAARLNLPFYKVRNDGRRPATEFSATGIAEKLEDGLGRAPKCFRRATALKTEPMSTGCNLISTVAFQRTNGCKLANLGLAL